MKMHIRNINVDNDDFIDEALGKSGYMRCGKSLSMTERVIDLEKYGEVDKDIFLSVSALVGLGLEVVFTE